VELQSFLSRRNFLHIAQGWEAVFAAVTRASAANCRQRNAARAGRSGGGSAAVSCDEKSIAPAGAIQSLASWSLPGGGFRYLLALRAPRSAELRLEGISILISRSFACFGPTEI